jgi:hypothetical protein
LVPLFISWSEIAAVELAEMPGEHEGHQQDRDRQDENMPGAPEVESTDTSQKDISHGEVEEAPEDVDRR